MCRIYVLWASEQLRYMFGDTCLCLQYYDIGAMKGKVRNMSRKWRVVLSMNYNVLRHMAFYNQLCHDEAYMMYIRHVVHYD